MQTAKLTVSETFEVAAAPDRVWELISDPARVVPCMPGAALGAVHPDGTIDGSITAGLGPVTVQFSGTVSPEYDDTGRSGRLMARGSDRGGRTKASATTEFRLENAAENRTAVIVDATFVVSGGLAPFAQTGGVHLVRSMMADFSENLSKLIAEDSADSGPPARTKLRGGRLGFTVLWGVIKEAFAKLVRGRRARATTSEEQHESQ